MSQGTTASLRLGATSGKGWRFRFYILTISAFCPGVPGLTFRVLPSKAGSGAGNITVSRGSRCAFETPGLPLAKTCKQANKPKNAISGVRGRLKVLEDYVIVTGSQTVNSMWNELLIRLRISKRLC